MHKDQDATHLLQLSEQWHEQQQRGPQGQQKDSAESHEVEITLPSGSLTPVPAMEMPEDYPHSCPALDPSFNTTMTTDNPMARSFSFDNQLLDPSLNQSTISDLPLHQRLHCRNISNPSNTFGLQRQLPWPSGYTSNFPLPEGTMQRTQSQGDYTNDPNEFQFANPADPMVNFQSSWNNPWSGVERTGALSSMNHSFRYDQEHDQIRRVKAPHTVAVLDSNRMAELASIQEVRSIMPNDLGGRQEELLLNIGGSTGNSASDIGPDSAAPIHQRLTVNVFPPENEIDTTPETAVGKIMDEINTFLTEYNSHSDNDTASMSQEDVISFVRSSLRSFPTTTISGGNCSARSLTAPAPSSTSPTDKKDLDKEKPQFPCPVEGCDKVKARRSELRKHMARHEKPYGCTSDGCDKTFGSKNDWKRHEQTQHEQPECWLCVDCHEVFYYCQDNYIQHMRDAHPMYQSQDGRYNARHFQIAANYQGHYWCGFCNQIMRHDKHGVDAVNARFNHIGDHFTKDKKTAKTWIELTGHGRRKEESARNPRERNRDDSLRDEAESILSSSVSVSSSSFSFSLDDASTVSMSPRGVGHQARAQARPNPTYNNADMNMPQRRAPQGYRPANLVICCHCEGSSSVGTSYTCMDQSCLHDFCPRCTYKVHMLKE